METIRTIGISICVTAVVTAIFSMLLPDSRFDRVLKFAISLFFLTGVISPFVSGQLDFRVSSEELELPDAPSGLEQQVEQQFSALAAHQLEAGIDFQLQTQGIEAEKVAVFIHIEPGQSVSISRITIQLGPEDSGRETEVQEIVRLQTGQEAEITVRKSGT